MHPPEKIMSVTPFILERRVLLVAVLLFILIQANSQTCTATFTMISNGNGNYTFSNTATITGSTTGTNSYWYFPGGTPSVSTSNSTVNVTYPANGTYTAYLSVVLSPSSFTCPTQSIFTVNTVCSLSPSFNYTLGPNGQVYLSSTTTGVTGYTWMPGGLTGPTATMTFPSNGSYPVYLFVTNGACQDSTSQLISINSICTLSANASYSLGAGGLVQFQNNTTGTASPTTYTWSFGDGNVSTAYAPAHTYSANGTYVATLTVVNGSISACASTFTFNVVVNNIICNANYTYSVLPNGVVSFSSTSQPATITSSYQWNFGGSTYSAIGSPTAITQYSVNGNYPVTLNFSSGTCSQSVTYTVVVNSIIPCVLFANFTYSVGPNGVVTFTNTSGGTTTATSYTWNFGDNTTSGAISPTHTYASMGFYNVTLFASDTTKNCSSDTTINVYVIYNCTLQAAFVHTVGSSGNVTYSSTSTGLLGGEVYSWEFGDGYKGNGQVVNHTYQNGGTHYVLLAVSNPSNIFCHDSIIQAVNITGVGCTADAGFTLTPTSTPQYWTATPVYPWNVVAARWSWGDGSHSDSLYVSHTYSNAGQYNICLTVTASCGSTATACTSYSVFRSSGKLVHVNVKPPSIVGIDEEIQGSNGILVYPVPANDRLIIHTGEKLNVSSTVIIIDYVGKVHIEKKADPTGESVEVDVSSLPAGIYMVHISSPTYHRATKFLIAR